MNVKNSIETEICLENEKKCVENIKSRRVAIAFNQFSILFGWSVT